MVVDPTDLDARYLKLDGSNANTDINIGPYNFTSGGKISAEGPSGGLVEIYEHSQYDGMKIILWDKTQTQYLEIGSEEVGYNFFINTSAGKLMHSAPGGVYYGSLLAPSSDNSHDLGASANRWKNAYFSGNITDGTNSLTVANAKAAYDHVSADGSSHTFIDQSVTTTASPSFVAITSSVATGTAPLTITSTTKVANLNVEQVDNADVGTSGATIPLLNGTNTWSGDQTFDTNTKLLFRDIAIYLQSSADGILDIVADATMNLASTITTLNLGNLTVTTANIATGATTANFGPVDDIVLGSSGKKVGFYGNAGAVIDTGWTTFTNLTTDRTCDADATSVAELADILGTLIEKLKALNLISA